MPMLRQAATDRGHDFDMFAFEMASLAESKRAMAAHTLAFALPCEETRKAADMSMYEAKRSENTSAFVSPTVSIHFISRQSKGKNNNSIILLSIAWRLLLMCSPYRLDGS